MGGDKKSAAKEKRKREKKEKKKKHGGKKSKHKKASKKRRRHSSESSSSSSGTTSSAGEREEPPKAPSLPAAYTDDLSSTASSYPMPKRSRLGALGGSGLGGLGGSRPAAAASSLDGSTPSASELLRRSERAERFLPSAADVALAEHRAATAAAAAAASAGAPPSVVQGSNQMLEKSYMRLTTLPSAADVRPLPVLRQAFELVLRRWKSERDYAYASDMLRSIRQDLTVQHLAAAPPGVGEGADDARQRASQHVSRQPSRLDAVRFATAVYEAHARIALHAADLDEFGACQAALVPLHAEVRSERAAEFGAYRLLHAAVLRGPSLAAELGAILGALAPQDARHPAVAQALRVAVALQRDDLVTALSELPRLRGCGAAVLGARLAPLRERALLIMCKAFQPSLPLRRVAIGLGYADGENGASECEAWLRGLGVVPVRTAELSHRERAPELAEGGRAPDAPTVERVVVTRGALRTLQMRAEAQDREEAGPPAPF